MKKHTKKAMPLIIGMVMFMNSAYADEKATSTVVPAADSVIEITEIAPGRGKMVRDGKEVEVKINRTIETKAAPEAKAVVQNAEESEADDDSLTAEEKKFQDEYDKLACEAKSENGGVRYAECLIKNLKQIQKNSESRKYNSDQQEEYVALFESSVTNIKNGLADMFKVSPSVSKNDEKFRRALDKLTKDFIKMIKPLKRVDDVIYAEIESMSYTLIAQLEVERDAVTRAETEKAQISLDIRHALASNDPEIMKIALKDITNREIILNRNNNSAAQLGLLEAQYGLSQNKLSFMNDNFERAIKALNVQIASFSAYNSKFASAGQIANQVFTSGRGIMSGTGLTSIPSAGSYFETYIGNNQISSDLRYDNTSIGSNRGSVIPQTGQPFNPAGGLNGGLRS